MRGIYKGGCVEMVLGARKLKRWGGGRGTRRVEAGKDWDIGEGGGGGGGRGRKGEDDRARGQIETAKGGVVRVGRGGGGEFCVFFARRQSWWWLIVKLWKSSGEDFSQ